jgi:hypothetical protein
MPLIRSLRPRCRVEDLRKAGATVITHDKTTGARRVLARETTCRMHAERRRWQRGVTTRRRRGGICGAKLRAEKKSDEEIRAPGSDDGRTIADAVRDHRTAQMAKRIASSCW